MAASSCTTLIRLMDRVELVVNNEVGAEEELKTREDFDSDAEYDDYCESCVI